MSDSVLLNEANLDQIDRLLVKHGKRVFGSLAVKAAWLPVILTNSLRASAGEIVPINVLSLNIEQLYQINPPRWLVKLRKNRVHEEDIEKILRLGINHVEQLKGLTDSFMRDAGIGLEARRIINRVIKSPNTPDHYYTIDLPYSRDLMDDSEALQIVSASNHFNRNLPVQNHRENNYPGRPVSAEIVENVIRFMTNQMEVQDPVGAFNIQRYVRTVVSLLLQILSGRVPFFRIMQVAGSIWDLLNQPTNNIRKLSEFGDQERRGKETNTNTSSHNDGGQESKSKDVDDSDITPNTKPRWVVAERDSRFAKFREMISQPPQFNSSVYHPNRDFVFRYPQLHASYDLRLPTISSADAKKDWTKSVHEVFKKPIVEYPEQCDFLIIGGGIMGLSTAYFIQQTWGKGTRVVVVDRDFNYTHAASNLSLGCIRQQFSHPTNIKMAAMGAQFYRQSKDHLGIMDTDPPDFNFHPQGYMFLVDPIRAENFIKYHETQTECGAYVDILSPNVLKARYPWLNTEGIVFATLGLQDEGWIDPFPVLVALKGKAEFLGTQFLEAEVFDFNTSISMPTSFYRDELNNPMEICNHAILRFPNDEIGQISFSRGIVCCGAESRVIAEALGIGLEPGIRRIPLPVMPRKRYVFVFNAPDAPVLDFPVIVDPSGVVCRRDGLGGNFIVTKYPTKDEEPDPGNLDVDYSFFEKVIYPVLSHRVKGFQKVKLVAAWAGYCDENVYDNNPIIGTHPYYNNITWLCGFGSHGIQMAPAVGRAMADFQLRGYYPEELGFNLFAFSWERMFSGEKIYEDLVL